MGRLLSSWPAHGEKRGKGEGDGALVFLFAQNSVIRIAPHPNAFLSSLFSNSAAQTVVTGFSDKTMAGFCTFFQLTLALVWAPHCVGSHKTLPHPLPPFPFFSPMGRLLSSWPAHGEKRGKGEGDGALVFLFAQNSFIRIAPHPKCLSFFPFF